MCTFIEDEDTYSFDRNMWVLKRVIYTRIDRIECPFVVECARIWCPLSTSIQQELRSFRIVRSHWQRIESHELKRIFLICVDYVNEAARRRIKAMHTIDRPFSVEI